nr:unnamed protein product [Callosobruchus analis]
MPKKKKRVLQPWTEEQKNVTLEYFKNHVKRRIAPKKGECEELKSKHRSLLESKSWEKIKIFVVNTYNKK